MQTLRRWYLYVVAFASMEVILWGIIGLARSFFSSQRSESVELLAGGLALILVGAPVFLLHGWLAQRSALRDEDERSSRTRSIFLYGALLATLLPVVQNFLALINRWVLDILSQSTGQAFIGAGQSSSDNLIAILANAAVAAGIFILLRQDWLAKPSGELFAETRRLYRYVWLVYALALSLLGTQQVFHFLFLVGLPDSGVGEVEFANGLSLALTGIPLWVFVRSIVTRSWQDPSEQESLLRRIVIFLLIMAGAIGGLIGSAGLLNGVLFFALRLISGAGPDGPALWGDAGEALAILLPYAAVWFYYQRILRQDLRLPPDLQDAERDNTARFSSPALRRSGLRRTYLYLLALLGLAWTLIGITGFLTMLVTLLAGRAPGLDFATIRGLTETLSAALVGLPVWITAWRLAQLEAAVEGEAGDHARRSLVRRGFIYLALIVGLAGVMVGAGLLFFNLFNAALGNAAEDLLTDVLQSVHVIVLYALVLVYHWLVLRADGRLAQRSLGRQLAQFPVLILAPDNGGSADKGGFSDQLIKALKHYAPAIPVAVHFYSQGVPDEQLSAARAVILPAELLAKPTEAIRLWLQGFDGPRLVIPTPTPGWQWILGGARPLSTLARQAAQSVRQLAEERES